MIGVVQYGIGNLGSVMNMFKRIDVPAVLVSTPEEILGADRLLLPGVGAFDRAAGRLEGTGLGDAIREFASRERPLLGICLGMQLLMDFSEEGALPGLGLVPGSVRRFAPLPRLRIPHMGWNVVHAVRDDALLTGLGDRPRFYFVHSYHVTPDDRADTLATTPHGGDFSSVIRRGSVVGAQFHPEKSHTFGMRMLGAFAAS